MTRKLIAILSLTLLMGPAANAALAPNYQRAKELTAVIDAVAAELPRHPITEVVYEKTDSYRVTAGPCSVTAMIVSQPQKDGMVGPRQFTVKLGTPRCKR